MISILITRDYNTFLYGLYYSVIWQMFEEIYLVVFFVEYGTVYCAKLLSEVEHCISCNCIPVYCKYCSVKNKIK